VGKEPCSVRKAFATAKARARVAPGTPDDRPREERLTVSAGADDRWLDTGLDTRLVAVLVSTSGSRSDGALDSGVDAELDAELDTGSVCKGVFAVVIAPIAVCARPVWCGVSNSR